MPELVTRIGNLTEDFDLRFTANGKAVANASIAFEPYDASTKTRGPVEFIRVTVWETLAENAVESLKKGDRVIVNGVPAISEFQGKKRKEITAVAIGPDIRFATTVVTKNNRKTEQPDF